MGWIKRCSINSAHCVALTNIFSWNFCVNLNRDTWLTETKRKMSSLHGLVSWSAFSRTIYKIQEMFQGSTRQKIFPFLTEKQQRHRDTSRHPVTTLPKMHTPQTAAETWQQAALQVFLVILQSKHLLTSPSPACEPTLTRQDTAPTPLACFPLELFTGRLQVWYKLVWN